MAPKLFSCALSPLCPAFAILARVNVLLQDCVHGLKHTNDIQVVANNNALLKSHHRAAGELASQLHLIGRRIRTVQCTQ